MTGFASPTVVIGIDQALVADATLMAMLVLAPRGVYAEGDVPPNHPVSVPGTNRVGFVTIGGSSERRRDSFGTEGADGATTIYVRSTNKITGAQIAREIFRVLNGKELPPFVMNPDSQALIGGDSVVNQIDDYPDDTGAHNTVLQYLAATVSTV